MSLTIETNNIISYVVGTAGFTFVVMVVFNLIASNVIDWFNSFGKLVD